MMASKIDLHSHSTCSDGTNSPSALVELAARAGVRLFALTDHDTVAGLDEARQMAERLGVFFVNGVEISCTHSLFGGYGKNASIDKIIHVVALNFDDVDKMHTALQALQDSRHQRGFAMVQKLAQILPLDTAEASKHFADVLWQRVLDKTNQNPKAVGRAHIAQALQEMGIVPTVQAAFDKYLADNKPAYIAIKTISMQDTIQLIHECGGVAVLAHPSRYKLSSTRIQRLIADFADFGGDGCELPNNEPLSLVQMVARTMDKHGLLASLGSDFHGSNMPWRKLGSTTKLLPNQQGIWQRFISDDKLSLMLS